MLILNYFFYNLEIYNLVNDIIPLSQYNNWNLFFLNSLNTVDMTLNLKIKYLLKYMFVIDNIYLIELSNYFISIIFVIIFSMLYIKKKIFSVYNIIKYFEIGWYLSFMYFVMSLFVNYINKFSWLANYFNLYNINIYIILSVVFINIVMFSTIISNKNLKEDLSIETLILIQLICSFGWSLLYINNFALFIICLEGFSLSLYILATTNRSFGGITSSIKYFIFGTLGSILLYLGCIMIYEMLLTTDINFVSYIFENNNIDYIVSNELYYKFIISINLIIIGLLIKLGAAPLHQWISDVYAGVPMFITAFYSTIVKIFLFILFLRFAISFITIKEIEYASILSVIIGCFGALRQVEIKRFLAYGSITHTGYLIIGDISSSYIYLITYMVATVLLFSILLNINIDGKEITYISDLRYINKSSSSLDRLFLVVVLASMAGLPPFAGFYGKMLVWMSLIEDIYLYNDNLSFVLLLLNFIISLLVIFYYMQIMCVLFINDEYNTFSKTINNINYKLDFVNIINQNYRIKFLQVILTLFLIFSIFLVPNLYFVI